MANSFDFELKADDQASASIQRIDEAVKNLLSNLTKAQDGLQLGGKESLDGLDKLNVSFKSLATNARESLGFVSALVPPLKTISGLMAGLDNVFKVINAVKNSVVNFADNSSRLATTAKNLGTTPQSYQAITGSGVDNGSSQDKVDNPVNKQVNILPAQQAVVSNRAGFFPDMLNYLRQATGHIQPMKLQPQLAAQSSSQKNIQNSLAFKEENNRFGAAWEGDVKKSQLWLGPSRLINKTADEVKHRVVITPDKTATASTFVANGLVQLADLSHQREIDNNSKETLSPKKNPNNPNGHFSKASAELQNSNVGSVPKNPHLNSDGQMTASQSPTYGPGSTETEKEKKAKYLSELERQFNIPSGVLNNIYQAESSGGKNLYSPKGAEGPFQFLPKTGTQYGLNNHEDRMDFNKSALATAKYIKHLLIQFHGDVDKAIAGYNWGPGNVKTCGMSNLPPETIRYLEKVMIGLPHHYPNLPESQSKSSNPAITAPQRSESGQLSPNINATQSGFIPETSSFAQDKANPIDAAMKDNTMQIELTVINGNTGERQIINTQRAKIATSMSFL